MPTVYLDSTIPSYLVAEPSRDLVIAGHQRITMDWWQGSRHQFDVVVSQAVVEEVKRGDSELARRRLAAIDGIKVLTINDDVKTLAAEYTSRLGLTGRARADVIHLAFAVSYEADYLATWNCKHLANGFVIRRLLDLNERLQRPSPVIVTPEELLVVWGNQDQ